MGPIVAYRFEAVFGLVHECLHKFEFRTVCGCDLLDAALNILVNISPKLLQVAGTSMLSRHFSDLFKDLLLDLETVRCKLRFKLG